MEQVSAFFSSVATRATDTVVTLSGTNRRTAETYLQNFLNASWSSYDNPLEPSSIDCENYVLLDNKGNKKNLDALLADASQKNRTQSGIIVSLLAGDTNDRFFFQTITSTCYGEGCVVDGKDVSFTQADSVAFGVIGLSKEGKVVIHEQR